MHLGGLGDDVGAESHLDAAGRGAADRHVEEDHRVGHCCGGEAEGQSWRRRRAGSSHTACMLHHHSGGGGIVFSTFCLFAA